MERGTKQIITFAAETCSMIPIIAADMNVIDARQNNPFAQDPITYDLYYNSGDFKWGYMISWATSSFLDLCTPMLSEKLKTGISFAVSTAAVCLEEFVGIVGGSTKDVQDIPAGLIGSVFYLGVHTFMRERFINRELNKNKTQDSIDLSFG